MSCFIRDLFLVEIHPCVYMIFEVMRHQRICNAYAHLPIDMLCPSNTLLCTCWKPSRYSAVPIVWCRHAAL